MITVNFISGLGADERVFQFLDIAGVEKNYIKWIDPHRNESLEHYVERLTPQIDKSKINILVCVSFGGLIGVELSKICHFNKVIIVSSVKNKNEIPFYYRIAGRLQIDKLVPPSLLKSFNPLLIYLFGVRNIDEKELLKRILEDTDAKFLKWAIGKILRWKNIVLVDNLYHIHGAADRLLPLRYIRSGIKVKAGHHFMIVSKSNELSVIINEILSGQIYRPVS